MTESNGKLRLGAAEWIALAALVLTPAGGFATWGVTTHARIAVIESTQGQIAEVLSKLEAKTEILSRLEVQQASIADRQMAFEQRLGRVEAELSALSKSK